MDIIFGFLLGICAVGLAAWFIPSPSAHPYIYHVAYSFEGEKGVAGLGSMTVNRTRKIKTADDVKSVQEFIEKESKFETIVIINWIALST